MNTLIQPAATAPAKPEKFKFYTLKDAEQFPEPVFLIKDILPKDAFAVFYAPAGTGKSFVALSMALSVAFGSPWLGKAVTKGAVIYVAAEGLYGFKKRIAAFRKEYHEYGANEAYLLGGNVNLFDATNIKDLVAAIKAKLINPALIVIDTYARCFIGGDENSSKDVGLSVACIGALKEVTNAAILLVHHTGKDKGSERGSSALRGAADVMFTLDGDTKNLGDLVTLKCDKMKDAEPFADINFTFKKVELNGGKNSLVVQKWEGLLPTEEVSEEQLNQTLEILRGLGKSGATYTGWKNAFMATTKKSKGSFTRALDILYARELVQLDKPKGSNGAKYTVVEREVSVSVSNASQNGSQTTTTDGLTSPPSLGGDTDTMSKTNTNQPSPTTDTPSGEPC